MIESKTMYLLEQREKLEIDRLRADKELKVFGKDIELLKEAEKEKDRKKEEKKEQEGKRKKTTKKKKKKENGVTEVSGNEIEIRKKGEHFVRMKREGECLEIYLRAKTELGSIGTLVNKLKSEEIQALSKGRIKDMNELFGYFKAGGRFVIEVKKKRISLKR